MAVVLGSANAYLGLKAGMTIAATYPAAVIGMALIKLLKGTILEENIARTVGSIGESVAAGAIFTIPAFVISGVWPRFSPPGTGPPARFMFAGGVLGILFVALLRRVMVEDADLPFPRASPPPRSTRPARRDSALRWISSRPWSWRWDLLGRCGEALYRIAEFHYPGRRSGQERAPHSVSV